jgi:hypothetical protein
MIDPNDPAAVCRSIGYFIQYLTTMLPLLGLAWATWRLAR